MLNKRYLIIVADRQKGRYFTMYGDNFEDEGEEIVDKDVPQKVKAEGYRIGKIDRHIRDHLYKHLKHVGKRALDYILKSHQRFDGVVVGGHDEILSTIRKYLPSLLKKRVIGQFIADTDLSVGELTEKAKKSLRK